MRRPHILSVLSVLLVLKVLASLGAAAESPPIYLWFEPEWFEGVEGSFAYWTGPGKSKPAGTWGVAGPGISAEWTQGGESEWNSMGVPAEETSAICRRDFTVPRTGHYRVWVRYVDHRNKAEPFEVRIMQGGEAAVSGELGTVPAVSPNDEYELYWGFSFGWAAVGGDLQSGPARLELAISRAAQAWRQVDAVLITDDPDYRPYGRAKPPFGYVAAMAVRPAGAAPWRGAAGEATVGASWQRPKVGGRDFSMWSGIDGRAEWWGEQELDGLRRSEVFFEFGPSTDIREKFHEQFAGQDALPILSWEHLLPGLYLGRTPDLSPGTPIRMWLEKSRSPFHILTNYANPRYDETTGPANYAALTGALAGQFLGYIHGESIGPGVRVSLEAGDRTRREYMDAWGDELMRKRAERWSAIYKTEVPQVHGRKGISCLSVDGIAYAHLFHEKGAELVAYEEDATNVHVPMRIAFMRGAARQYKRGWINYASGNFGDACNYFTQKPVVPRGAPGWFHSKYAITDGVSACWYRKLYYLNFLGGASAIFWEQGLANMWMLPGPGTHPVQLSPFGRATEEFHAFVDRLPDRGEPYTPVALLLSYGHAYDRVNYRCKMVGTFRENIYDRELRELFNVCWFPSGVVEGQPAAPDVQSMPSGAYGNIFDVLVDRPDRAQAIFDYPVVWAAGDVDLSGEWPGILARYLRKGGTLVVNVEAARDLPGKLTGVNFTGEASVAETWSTTDGGARGSTPLEVACVELKGADVLLQTGGGVPLITRHAVGDGALITTLIPHMTGQDERAHPALPYLMNGLVAGLMPVEVHMPGGETPRGEIMYQVNRTADGYLVMLVNNRGVDKTQSGVARVDRRAFVDVELGTRLELRSAREYTQPRDLPITREGTASRIPVRVEPGDVQVIYLETAG